MAAILFSLAGYLAMAGWLALALSLFLPSMRNWTWRISGAFIPAMIALAYVYLLLTTGETGPDAGFGSIEAVRALFLDDHALAAGWLHYLAFDLFVGTWVVRSGLVSGVHPLLLLPCLPLTFMLGPAGYLAGLIVLLAFGDRSWTDQPPARPAA